MLVRNSFVSNYNACDSKKVMRRDSGSNKISCKSYRNNNANIAILAFKASSDRDNLIISRDNLIISVDGKAIICERGQIGGECCCKPCFQHIHTIGIG